MKSSVIFLVILLTAANGITECREIRSLWVMPWNLTTPEQIDELIQDAVNCNQTEILAEVRYRADAMYVPNKVNSDYNNPEPRSYLLRNGDFDPLEYLLTQAHEYGIEVQAWVSALNVVSPNGSSLSSNYIYREHKDWILVDSSGSMMNGKNYLGYFVDPGNPEVKNHLLNILLDIVVNYPGLDGIHLDYIRYPASRYGHNRASVLRYKEATKTTPMEWNDWRILQVSELIREFRKRARLINPSILITAAVFADMDDARFSYAQDWPSWLKEGLIDRAYPMAYAKKYTNFHRIISNINDTVASDSVVIGIRAWQENYPYIDHNVYQIIEKARLCRQMGFAGIALFSYEGVKKAGMLSTLTSHLFNWQESELPDTDDDRFIEMITSTYRATPSNDSLLHDTFIKPNRSVSMFNDHNEIQNSDERSFCDEVSYDNGQYYFSFFFKHEDAWTWEIRNENDQVVADKKMQFPRGFYVDVWSGLSKSGEMIDSGIYSIVLKDTKNAIVDQKRFIVE